MISSTHLPAIPAGNTLGSERRSSVLATCLDVMLPREHGSWSLAFEPLAFGLLSAPSGPGAWLALAMASGFLCRRPLRVALHEPRAVRRRMAWRVFLAGGLFALAALSIASAAGGVGWLVWLLPTLACGVVFVLYEARNGGREEVAEVAGTLAFALLPAPLAILGGFTGAEAFALAAIMGGRLLPTVIFVRAFVRGRKVGRTDLRWGIFGALFALAVAGMLVLAGLAPWWCTLWFGFLLGRMVVARRFLAIRPKNLGIFEAVVGAVFAIGTALAWRL
jgi:hypothetical protein